MASPQWQKILSAGLCPNINSQAEYERLFTIQLNTTYERVAFDPASSPDKTYIQTIHKSIFENIVPWAGRFRPQTKVVVFDGGTIGTDGNAIAAELDQIARDTELALQCADNKQEQAIAITVYQARMRRCHPFLDGNSRTGACLLQSQVFAIFGVGLKPLPKEKSSMYKDNLALAYRGIIAPFANNFILEPLGLDLVSHVEVSIPKQLFIDTR